MAKTQLSNSEKRRQKHLEAMESGADPSYMRRVLARTANSSPAIADSRSFSVSGEDIKTGRAMEKVSTNIAEHLKDKLSKPMPQRLTWGSACSGSGMDEWIADSLEELCMH